MLEAGFIKFHQLFQKLLMMGGGGALQLRLLFCEIVCHDYFSLQHNVLCLSFVVVLYSMYSLYTVIKMALLDEGGCHV